MTLSAAQIAGGGADVAVLDTTRRESLVDEKGKLALPPTPEVDDLPGLSWWLTLVLNLDFSRPVISGERQGMRGPEGHVVLKRSGAPPLRFEPATRINTPARLIETLAWSTIPTDGEVPPIKSHHCQQIAYVVKMLCGVTETMTDEQETAGLVGAYLQSATVVEGCTTYGTTAQRYEAATALSGEVDANGRPLERKYLLDENTGEIVIRVGDLNESARRYVGGAIARGWVVGRMDGVGGQRITLDGHATQGRSGRSGLHARCAVYRGLLPTQPEAVTT
jgi:hypothetical protein